MILGFPSDLPRSIIDDVNILASREALGQTVPATIFRYRSDDGRERALVWLPRSNFATLCDRLGVSANDGPEAA
jgi:hypothetical protein